MSRFRATWVQTLLNIIEILIRRYARKAVNWFTFFRVLNRKKRCRRYLNHCAQYQSSSRMTCQAWRHILSPTTSWPSFQCKVEISVSRVLRACPLEIAEGPQCPPYSQTHSVYLTRLVNPSLEARICVALQPLGMTRLRCIFGVR